MHIAAGSIADFTGTLVEAHQKPGNKYIQLIFHTAEGIRLSISRNTAQAKSLVIGEKYHVKGKEYKLGSKVYVHEPTTVPIAAGKLSNKRKLLIVAVILSLVVAAIGAYAVMTRNVANVHAIEAQRSAANTSSEKSDVKIKAPAVAAPATQPAAAAEPVVNPVVQSPRSTSPKRLQPTTPLAPNTTPTPAVATEQRPSAATEEITKVSPDQEVSAGSTGETQNSTIQKDEATLGGNDSNAGNSTTADDSAKLPSANEDKEGQ